MQVCLKKLVMLGLTGTAKSDILTPFSPQKEKTKAELFYCSPFAIFLEDIVKIGSALLRYRDLKRNKQIQIDIM